ncbi:MAG: C40 family peptidase [Actinomycetota bacterium]|nr:C40 family peptidase [Actinomycetota bacterium]
MKQLALKNSLCVVCALAVLAALLVVGAGTAGASTTGGAAFVPPPPPPTKAKVVRGKAIAPRNAPPRVKRIIRAGNRLIGKPYKWGGGHGSISKLDRGYDCSGTISYALYGARLMRSPLTSGGFMSWGRDGPGKWVTVYAHGGHAYLVVAGLRIDTGYRDDPSRTGPQWSKRLRKSAAFTARHPRGL